jgi:hypothetical protein
VPFETPTQLLAGIPPRLPDIAILCFTVCVAEPECGADQAVAHSLFGWRPAIGVTCLCAHCLGDDGIVDGVCLFDRHFLSRLSLRSGRHDNEQGEGREADQAE